MTRNETGWLASAGVQGSFPVNLLLQRPAHDTQRRGFVRPDLQRLRALMEQHAEAVGRAASGGFRRLEQRRLDRAIDEVVNAACLLERKLFRVERQIVSRLQTQRSCIDDQV